MSNVAAVLRQEITRLARREARSLTKSLAKAVAQFRRDIAELKRENSKARAQISNLVRQALEVGAAPVAETETDEVRFSARSVAAQRKRLGLSAADFGKLCGVTAHTVYKWEHGTARPRRAQLAAFVVVRGMGKTEAKQRLGQLGAKAPKERKNKR